MYEPLSRLGLYEEVSDWGQNTLNYLLRWKNASGISKLDIIKEIYWKLPSNVDIKDIGWAINNLEVESLKE